MGMGFLCCFKTNVEEIKNGSKERAESARDGNNSLATLVNDMSLADSVRHRIVAEEILKIANGNTNDIRTFSFAELVEATEDFKEENLIGEGGFGRVFRGYLKDSKQDIAVKQLDRNGMQGNREFLVEVLMLNLLHNEYLVNLIGYCADGAQRLLVYDFLENGSLEDHLLDLQPNKKALDWKTRMKVALGAAKGLEYLHDAAKTSVIYRDFKASNILLDKDFNARLSDFGLARIGPRGGKMHVSTRVMGTYGYCAPEYVMTGKLTTMSDVYSFGVVFLEIVTGRRVIDTDRPSSEQNLIHWAEPLFRDKKKFIEMADPLLEGNFPKKSLYQALAVAAMCLQEEASTRPLISDVVTALEYLSTTNKDSKQTTRKPTSPNSESDRCADTDNADKDNTSNEEEDDNKGNTERETPKNENDCSVKNNAKEEDTAKNKKGQEAMLHSQEDRKEKN